MKKDISTKETIKTITEDISKYILNRLGGNAYIAEKIEKNLCMAKNVRYAFPRGSVGTRVMSNEEPRLIIGEGWFV